MFLPSGSGLDGFAYVREPTRSPSLGHVIPRCDTTLRVLFLIVGALCDGFTHRSLAFVTA
jgi:hypothetical protein